jgi:CubicO group peptidase (beta-lactamase class C family)
LKKITQLLILLISCSGAILGQDNTFTGYATCSIRNGASIIQTHGFKNKERSLPYDSLTIQPIGSVSKTLVGLAVVKAVELGLVDLDTDINKYLDFQVKNPRVKQNQVITLRHLASHTSGIIDHEKYYLLSYSKGLKSPISLGEYLKGYLVKGGSMYSGKNFGKYKAGEAYHYSNVGAALAAYVIECAAKQPFDRFSHTHIVQPLGMKHTSWFYDEEKTNRYSDLFDENDKPLERYALATYPDGGLRTTITDLSIYLRALINGYHHQLPILENKTWDTYFVKNFSDNKPVKDMNPKEPNIGIFIVYTKNGTIGHTGSDPGVSAVMSFNPQTGEGKIFMANEDITPKNMETFREIWSKI